ncbi:hypothetical protein HPC49_01625 [Pyxidicoccus fallax]|uniref:Nuclear transport factor 2 family protein n=1 Tax=Pyxidicoccus fallax TaxID=394095 RepID=A0A848LC31_9BACT|nr:hypothetical protein [Pyxidicoccus fallax]NMO16034.1 nuclear transport factor 2 family protein [Pyxidicoccus fallax]NPC76953.1 hypothetical protein [Pyxidicoccus fallax]
MMRRIALCLTSLALASPVWAQGQPQSQSPSKSQQQQQQPSSPASGGSGAPMDLSKMGPWTRKPTNEARTRKEVEAFIKEEDAIMKRRDFEASLARIDFPMFMATDNSQGMPTSESYDRQRYTQIMKPFFDQTPTDMQVNHNLDITVLSDSLVTYTDNYTMTTKGEKRAGRNAGLLVKREGQWKWKAFIEPGWGDPSPTGVGGSGVPQGQDTPKQ